MTNSNSGMPGVTVDQGRVSDFLHGMQGSNREYNAKARKTAIEILIGMVAYSNMRRKNKKGK